jgi:uroporphyrinogen decarboxylase
MGTAFSSGDRFLRACHCKPVDATPVWFMRQAGRYLPDYRVIRQHHSILEICHAPQLAAEVSLQPVELLDVDAAIIFADILLPFEPLGLKLTFQAGEGPVLQPPIRTRGQIERLPVLDPEADLGYVLETVRLVREGVGDRVPVIGFAGAPFTVASYGIEGGSSRHFVETKRLMYGEPNAWHDLLDRLATGLGRFLNAQARAGAQALQLFDSWVGCLTPSDYRRFVLPHTRKTIATAQESGVPVIHYGTGTATLLDAMAEAGGDVISVDWRIPLDDAWQSFPTRAIQGNLDPVVLFAPLSELRSQVEGVIAQAAGKPGHIFNLGHGILPGTQPERVRAVVDMVREGTRVQR